MRRHWIVLLALTGLLRGVLFVSYPLGSVLDDNQAFQRYLIDQLVGGNLLIGSLRPYVGYPLAIAPIAAFAAPFGQFEDRIILAVQVGLSACVPLLIYDAIRRRRGAREAFIVALVVLLDPLGLQAPHVWLPEWWIAFCIVVALWALSRFLPRSSPRREHSPPLQIETKQRGTLLLVVAGLMMGAATLARVNFALIAAVMGATLLPIRALSIRRRLIAFTVFGAISAGVLGAYLLLIHYPSTGTFALSCLTAGPLLPNLVVKGVPVERANGEATQQMFDLLSVDVPQPIIMTVDSYPYWQIPGVWATPDQLAAFERAPRGEPVTRMTSTFPEVIYYYLGACAADSLLARVHAEAIAAHPLTFALASLRATAHVFTQIPIDTGFYDRMIVPRYETLTFDTTRGAFGFHPASGSVYSGEWVWTPGAAAFSAIFDLWNLYKVLTPLAILWALVRARDWLYGAPAVWLIAFALMMGVLTRVEPRYYTAFYPIYTLLLGGMLADALRWLRTSRKAAS